MPKFNVNVSHAMQREQAVEKLKGFSEQVRSNATVEVTDISEHWDDQGNLTFAFKAMGLKVSGAMQTTDSEVNVRGDLPFAAVMFRGAIETQIKEQIEQALSS